MVNEDIASKMASMAIEADGVQPPELKCAYDIISRARRVPSSGTVGVRK